jgi:hypothetical protein
LTAVSFGYENTDKPKPASLFPERLWGLLLAIALLGEILEFLLSKFPGCLDDIFLLIGQVKVQKFAPFITLEL